jgi:hypothetical protein
MTSHKSALAAATLLTARAFLSRRDSPRTWIMAGSLARRTVIGSDRALDDGRETLGAALDLSGTGVHPAK